MPGAPPLVPTAAVPPWPPASRVVPVGSPAVPDPPLDPVAPFDASKRQAENSSPAEQLSIATAIEVLAQPCSDAREIKVRLASVLAEYRGLEPAGAPPRRPILRLPAAQARGARKPAAAEPVEALLPRRGASGEHPGRANGA